MRKTRPRGSVSLDITPLIDVLFLLIIFFVLTASFVQGKLDVTLPNANGKSAEADKAVTVTVDRDGLIYWSGRKVSKAELSSLAFASKTREVAVAGDEKASYGDVAEVLAILRAAGIESAGLLTQGEK